ncbi:hypothetical protein ONA91_39130 [Micromonospora sp. DR5-3]|uniref:FtsX-like permease family protein n=1 Tax=unclassified Micromonospora TaxID=2617518 RepID=UPI0011D6BB96|nr:MULTISPECIES: FtsX-like permease family protein [unclassified Micromonospora]MCW3820462.1 hypothetical protein [Micromonospora sp. DR5-3]TYC20650.1 hypothetical protein FXF52_30080 [Micromonospora sp. MP36]
MLHLVFGVLASRKRQALSLALLAVLALAAGTAAPLYAAAADRQVVFAEVAAATPIERSVAMTAQVSSSVGAAAALADLVSQLRGAVRQSDLTEITGGWVRGRAVVADAPTGPLGVSLVVRDEVCHHLALSGTCPSNANEVAISTPTARQLGLHPGAELSYQVDGREQPLALRVVSIYDPVGPSDGGRYATPVADPYWAGRHELAPQPVHAANPIFTSMATLSAAGLETMVGTVDLVAGEHALTPESVRRLAPALAQASYGPGLEVASGLPQLLARIEHTRQVLHLSAPLGALQLLVLSWLVLLLAAGYAAAERRTETALTTLRGAPTRHRILLALGPTALVLAAAAPFGFGLGWLLVRAITWTVFTDSGAVPVDSTSLAAAGITLLAVLAGAAIAERRSHGGPLAHALRQIPPRRRVPTGLVELGAIVLALAAVAQSMTSRQAPGGGLPLLAPALLALVAGILAARLMRSIAAALGARSLHRGRVAVGLAAIQIARRRGADRLVALIVVALALVGFAASAWDARGQAMRDRAAVELGAARVLTVHAVSRPALLSAVRAADPDGRWAMAAARQTTSDTTLVAVDSPRLAAVALWPSAAGASAPAQVAATLRPAANPPVQLTGAALALDVTVREPLSRPLPVTVALTGPRGEPLTGSFEITAEPGRRQYRIEVPACVQPPGCRLGWLSFARSPDRLVLNRIGQLAPERPILEGRALAAAARWRSAIGAEDAVRIHGGDEGVVLSYAPPRDAQTVSTDIRLQVADAPLPLPVVAAAPARLADTQELRAAPVFAGLRRVEVAQALPVLPGVGSDGILADLEYADRLSDQQDNEAELQVWLGADAPADAVARLRAAGLVPLRDEAVVDRAARYRMRGPGLGLLLQLIASILTILLAALAVVVLAATDRPRRAVDLDALRLQGVDRRTVARAVRGCYLALVGVAVPVGALATGLAWVAGQGALAAFVDLPSALAMPGPRLAVVVPAMLGAAALLVGVALLAAHGLARATEARPLDAAEARG